MNLATVQKSSGQGLVEYALILVLVAIAVIVMLTLFGQEVAQSFNTIITFFQGF